MAKSKRRHQDFPGGPVVKTSPANAGSVDSIPGWGVTFPHASQPKTQHIKQKQYCNNSIKTLKNGQHQKIFKNKRHHHDLYGASALFPSQATSSIEQKL